MQDYEAEGNKLPQSFHKLWDILMKASCDPVAGEVVCILDALDECAELPRYQIIDAISALYKRNDPQSASRIKFLVTSRPYLGIERRFKNLIRSFPTIHISGEMEADAISREINLVIKRRVSELGQDLELDESELLMIRSELLRNENRTYLWVKLMLEAICDEICLTKRKLKQIMSSLPSTVDDVYESILSKARDKDKAEKLLHITIAATRPLTLREMNIALAIEDYHECYEDLDLEKETRFKSSIRNLCGLFISIVDRRVYLIHQTAREFLVTKGKALIGRWKHSIDPIESELVMAKACIRYLRLDASPDVFLGGAVPDDSVPDKTLFDNADMGDMVRSLTEKERGFFGYAARFWSQHYRKAEKRAGTELLQTVLQTCDPRDSQFIGWFNIYKRYNSHQCLASPTSFSSLTVASFLGHEVLVKSLLAMGQMDINLRDNYGQTPLFCGAGSGYEAVVRLLLTTDQVDVNLQDNAWRTPLSMAALNGHEAVVRLLLTADHVDVNLQDNVGQTPLLIAALNGHKVVVRLLLATDHVDVNLQDEIGQTPLLVAALNGHEAVVRLLLTADQIDVNLQNRLGQTPLYFAARDGNEAIVRLLLTTDQVNVNLQTKDGETPLLMAALFGHETVVQLLLTVDQIDVNLKSNSDQTPLLAAAAGRAGEVIVRLLLTVDHIDVNLRNYYGLTPLFVAVREWNEAVVKLLLAKGANVDLSDGYGRTPLSWAARDGNEAVVKLLLEAGANIDLKDMKCQTPLSWAAGYGKVFEFGKKVEDEKEAAVKLLLEAGATVDDKDVNGRTPLSWAAADAKEDVVKLLLEAGANVECRDEIGRTPLSWAAEYGKIPTVKLLLAAGANVDSIDNAGRNILFYLRRRTRKPVDVKLLTNG